MLGTGDCKCCEKDSLKQQKKSASTIHIVFELAKLGTKERKKESNKFHKKVLINKKKIEICAVFADIASVAISFPIICASLTSVLRKHRDLSGPQVVI